MTTAKRVSHPQASLILSPILEAALVEFAANGYAATSVRTISQRVGVTVPALYYHYENKQAILVALLDHSMSSLHAEVAAALAAAGNDPVKRLRWLVTRITKWVCANSDLAILDVERRSLEPANFNRYVAQRYQVEAAVRSAIADGVVQGVFVTPSVGDSTRAILAMLQGINAWYRAEGPSSSAEIAERQVHFACALLGYRD